MEKIIFTIILVAVLLRLTAQNDFVTNSDLYTGSADITATQKVTLADGFHAAAGSNVHVHISATASYPDVQYTEDLGSVPTQQSPSDKNYIRTFLLRESNTGTFVQSDERIETTQYFDGLGRLSQTVILEGSPSNYDIVVPAEYDNFGRETGKYLPFVKASNNGAYVDDADAACISYYDNSPPAGHSSDGSPYTQIRYENSPLNRVLGEYGIGDGWQNNPDTIKYLTNTDPVNSWDENGGYITYSAGELHITQFVDEDKKKTREYKNKLGQVVLKEAWDGTEWLKTYYIYDDFGLLRCVVPPEAGGPNNTGLCYFYTYDERRRLVEKNLPGADVVYLVYDARDRLAMTQNGHFRSIPGGFWLATIYDAFNRPVITVVVSGGTDLNTVRSDFAGFSGYAEQTTSGNFFGYDISGAMPGTYTFAKQNVETITYYDKYDFLQASDFTSDNYGYSSYNISGYPAAESGMVKGFVTGGLAFVMGEPFVYGDNRLLTVSYYDEYGREIRTIADNHLGGKDVTYAKYNFSRQVEETVTRHNVNGSAEELKLTTSYNYNHQGLLLDEKVKIGDNGENITTFANKYNEIGEPVQKYLHGDASGHHYNQVEDYAYNTKGWLSKINTPGSLGDDLFALDLRYNIPDGSNALDAIALYNGNISEMMWQTTGNVPKGYGFSYDGVNRLTNADFGSGSNYADNGLDYNTSYTYYKNGNIHTLSRYLNNNQIDDLTYTYYTASNQLQTVNDATSIVLGYNDNDGEYSYDANGNLISDPSKGIDNIFYNFTSLNLPRSVSFGGGDYIHYYYAGDGTKLQMEVIGPGAENSRTVDYVGPFLYENDELKCIFTSEGRIVRFDNDGDIRYKYEYFMKDHLGNARVVFAGHGNGKPELMQTTDYYPFGLDMEQHNHFAETELENDYLYNGKELQNDILGGESLNWYDYGARFYDPQLGRWHSVDPLAESYYSQSPYHFTGNNPIKFIDLNGMNYDEYNYYEDDNRFEKVSNKGGDKVQYVNFVDSEGNVNEQVSVKGKTAHVTELRDGYAVTNFDPEIPDNYNKNSGYEYSQADFKERKEITDTGNNPITTALKNTEKSGDAGPVHAKEYWNKYGHTLGSMMLMESYVGAALDITDVGNLPMSKAAGIRMKSSAKLTSTGSSSSNMSNSWNKFLSANKGKYSGKNWIKQATKDYYKSSFYNTK